jgi:hypothetical protein
MLVSHPYPNRKVKPRITRMYTDKRGKQSRHQARVFFPSVYIREIRG